MRARENIEKIIKKFDIDVNPEKDQRIFDELKEVHAKSQRSKHGISKVDIGRIIMKSKITKFATAAAMMAIAVLIGMRFFNGTSAWAKVIQAFNEVENVHIIQKMTATDGTVLQGEYYLKKPDHLYQGTDSSIVVDDGRERLTIDNQKKTAQFSDSFMSFKPLDKHYMFDTINLFRGNGHKDVEFTLLDDQSDETTLVFSLKTSL